jgi:ABC-type dipeptide/oligopeptide/nickel transport system ATPase component
MNMQTQLLHIEKLKLHFRTQKGAVQAVDEVNFDLDFNKAVVIMML